MLQWLKNAKRIERGFVITPASEGVQNAFALFVIACSFLGRFRRFCGALQRHDWTFCHKFISYRLLFCHRTHFRGFPRARGSARSASALLSPKKEIASEAKMELYSDDFWRRLIAGRVSKQIPRNAANDTPTRACTQDA